MTNSAHHLQLVREGAPLVHCITNYVAMNIAANTLLARSVFAAIFIAT